MTNQIKTFLTSSLLILACFATGCEAPANVSVTVTPDTGSSDTGSGGTTSGGSSGGTSFTVSLSGVSPVIAPAGGFTLTLTGNFQSGISISIGGTTCSSMTIVSSSQATCVVPALSAGVKDVQVTYGSSQVLLSSAITVNAAPAISSLAPIQSFTSGGSTLTITGSGFLSGAVAKIGTTVCPNVSLTATQIVCTIPAGSAATLAVTVTNADAQLGTLAASFTYSSAPSISSLADVNLQTTTVVSPNAGTVLNVLGSGFQAGAVVKLNGTDCSTTTVVSSNRLTCTQTGATTSGKYTVTVLSGGQTATAPSQIRFAKATKLFRNQFYNGAALMSDGSVQYWRAGGQVLFSTQNQGLALAHPLLGQDCTTELSNVVDLAVTPNGNTMYAVLSTGAVMFYDSIAGGSGTLLKGVMSGGPFGWNANHTAQGWNVCSNSMANSGTYVGTIPAISHATQVVAGNDFGCVYQNTSPTQVWCWGNQNNFATMPATPPTNVNNGTYVAPTRISILDGAFSGANWSMAATNTQLCFTINGGAANNSSMTYCAGQNVYGYADGYTQQAFTVSASPSQYSAAVTVLTQAQANTYKGFAALSSGGNMGMCGVSPTGKDVVCWNGTYDDVTFGLGTPQQIYSTGSAVVPNQVSIVSDQFMVNGAVGTSCLTNNGITTTSCGNFGGSYLYPTFQNNIAPGAICVLFSDGHVSCSGSTGVYGQGLRGDGTTTQNLSWLTTAPSSARANSFSTSVLLPSGSALSATAISSECAIDQTGSVYCWGGNQELTNTGKATFGLTGLVYNDNSVTTPPASLFTGKAVAMTYGN